MFLPKFLDLILVGPMDGWNLSLVRTLDENAGSIVGDIHHPSVQIKTVDLVDAVVSPRRGEFSIHKAPPGLQKYSGKHRADLQNSRNTIGGAHKLTTKNNAT